MKGLLQDNRGAVQITDIILTFVVLVSLIVLAPVLYRFVGLVSGSADPLTALLLQLFIPLLFIVVIISAAISARRDAA